jgi:CheY-like chemotaxis protein
VFANGRERRERVDHHEAMARLRGARVLLVEDNEFNQELALDLLRSAGIVVDLASNGEEALERLAEGGYDGVLMDCQMPVMDGYSATRALRAMPGQEGLPVIAMTANAMVGDVERALAAGMNDHIAKPINVREMFVTMARWIRPSRPGRAPVAAGAELAGEDALPENEWISASRGIERLAGNRAAYRKLLDRFAVNQRQTVAEIEQAWRQDDRERAQRLAHTLKGVAGSIGAQPLSDSAARLEAGLQGAGPIAELLAQCGDELGRVLAALPQAAQPVAATRGLSAEELRGRLAALRERLLAYDAESEEALEEILGALAEPASRRVLEQVRARLAAYDYDAALQLLDEMTDGDEAK